MEAGNREEEDRRRLGPAVPSSPYSPHHHYHYDNEHHHHQPPHQQQHSHFSPSRHQRHFSHDRTLEHEPAVDYAALSNPYDDRSPQIPVASYAANNYQASATNATIDLAGAFGNPAPDPDDFYRNYRGVQSNANITLLPSPIPESMASAVSGNRQVPSPRTNGAGTPKQPGISGTRIATRPAYRSASNPVDDRSALDGARARSATSNGYNGGGQPSVKDLKKRFDQTTSQPVTGPRKLTPRNPPKDANSSSINGRSPVLANGQSYSALRGTTSRESGSDSTRTGTSRGTQRTKFVAEDHMSSNSQSFASRISRPRTSVSSNAQASKSMTHLPPAASPNPPSSPPPPARTGGLLFGEILPEELDAITAGYGIDVARPRRTSDSNIHKPINTHHQRSLSDAVVEPVSPTDWYRSASTAPPDDGQAPSSRIPKSHTRAHSDLAGSKPNSNSTIPQHRRNVDRSHPPTQVPPQPPSPSSRLPLSVKKLNSPSNPTSPASTRSNSPANAKRPVNNGRTSRTQGPPVAMNRAKTPTTRSTTPTARAKTPTHTNASTRKPAPTTIATPNNNRLAAYISAPPPKLSPPLRSSRPRQPVSSATTASSRLKQVDRSKSPHKPVSRPPSRPASRQDAPTTRRRKISVGPVDFAERRETIKLKYSKSIRESEARQAREAAAERRKKELEAAARAKVQAEAKAQAAAAAAEAAAAQAREHMKSAESSRPASPAERQLRITTALVPPTVPKVVEQQSTANDSPTLGVPGSFPSFGSPPIGSDDAPLSAVSATTVVTEFDGETQTEPPVQEQALHIVQPDDLTVQPRQSMAAHEKAMYRDPFEDDGPQTEHASIKISLEAASPQEAQQVTPTRSEFDPEPSIPGAFQDEYEHQPEYEPQHYFEPQPEEEAAQPQYEPEPEYEPQPYVAPAYQKTTVTILSRDPGFGPFHIQPVDERMDYRGEGQEDVRKSEEQQVDPLEHFYIGPHLKDNIASLRDSTLSGSEQDAIDEQAVFTDPEHTPDTSNSLTVPPLMSPANRSSQHSVWTDFSIDSNESHGRMSRDSASHYPASNFHDGRHSRPADSRPESIREEMSFHQQPYSPDMSPLDVSETSVTGRFPSYHEKQHSLPELDTGDGFAIPYMANATKVPLVPQLPDHAPPPPPSVSEDHHYANDSRRTSGYYDEARPSSSLHREDRSSFTFAASRRESEDFAHALSTPHSADQVSLDIEGVTPGLTPIDGERRSLSTGELPTKTASTDKEKNRLTQRQMVIRELIDTEAVFVRDMNVIEEIYKGTAEACPKLDTKTIKLIFRNTDEIITFHTAFLQELKEGVASVYVPNGRRSPALKEETTMSSDATTINSIASTVVSTIPSTAASSTTAVSVAGLSMSGADTDDTKDRQSTIGPCFSKNIDKMKAAHEGFLRTSDHAAKRLIQIQEDPTVKVWLNECNEVAKDLTAAWNLDSLLIKPMQRITKYPNLISQLLQYTPADHPDRDALVNARVTLENAILEINKTKKNFELVGQIVGRKRKESDVKAGFAKAFGRRVDKLQASSNRPEEDPEYSKLHEKFGDDYLRLQVVLRDVEFYTRQVSAYVHEFLQYLSSIELVMRLQPGPYPEIESKWVQFNVSMRDIEKVALEQHLSQVRKHVIEPFELVIRCYGNPSLAMKKRSKRRLDYEKYIQLKKGGKKIDKSLSELVEQYEALNETLKKELPKLSALTEKIGNICLGNFVNIQAKWYSIWKEKVKVVLGSAHTPEMSDVVNTFHRDFKDMEEAILSIGILNPSLKGRSSQSTTDGDLSKTRSRPSDLSTRTRGLSVNSEVAPTLPTPDFAKRNSGQFTLSPTATLPSPHQYYYRDYYAGINGHARGASSPITPELSAGARSAAPGSARPSTGRSYDSTGAPRPSIDSTTQPTVNAPRDPNSAYNSPIPGPEGRRFSGLFHSALPLADATEESQRSSRASSRERNPSNGYNVLWLAASLFEFNIETTKHEAGYPYLTYQAGEIFDVIAEKGELWLAKNQDDPDDMVGWIWSKHFAKLADS